MIWDKLRNELIDIVEWLDSSNDTLVHRFERYDNEIKNGAQLIVREGQQAVFIDQGQIAEVFKPGKYTLDTDNLPLLATIKGWKHGFHSPFKCEVYFVSTRRYTDQKWGTKNPIMLRDAEFGPIRMRAFGTYAFRVEEAGKFIQEIVGTDGYFTTDEITNQLRNIIVSRFTDILGESKIPALDLAANYDELGTFVTDRIASEVTDYGLLLTKLLIENISLPEAVEEALDKRTSMGVIGDLDKYLKFQSAEAMEAAANNPSGGGASEGLGLGMGMAMASQMMNNMPGAGGKTATAQGQTTPAAASPPPLPGAELVLSVYAGLDGKSVGPLDESFLRKYIREKKLTRDTLVWQEGQGEWAAASEVPAVARLFGTTPPPLPGS